MSVCKHCSGIGGYHWSYCPTRYAAGEYSRASNEATETKES